ncbi:hypothetical protein BS17DRAFT_428311 [Gyrodon lividus]|nr:hypothetical protein BS17DRAFT_428311 [Gyrodon lividus]
MPYSEPPHAVYARLMVSVDESRGYPLYIPEPDSRLPDDYDRTGPKIGDVGVVAEDGSFDVFFNICLPENHPIHHPHGVPSNFKQVILNHRDIREFPRIDTKGLVLATRSVSQRTLSSSLSGNAAVVTPAGTALSYEFSSSSSEGAILALPEGAGKADLANHFEFRQVALENAASWYHFACCHLGRTSINNDSLYLITGFHKTSSWSLASFSQAERNTAFSFSFTAGPVINGNVAAAYSWAQGVTNSVLPRSGPEQGYNQDSPNQTLFIRGYKIAIREGAFISLLGGRTRVSAALPRARFDQSRPFNSDRAVPGSSPGYLSCDRQHCTQGRQRGISRSLPHYANEALVGTPTQTEAIIPFPVMLCNIATDVDPYDGLDGLDVSLQRVPGVSSKAYHPADVINQFLLDHFPSADVAVTHDSQWCNIPSEVTHLYLPLRRPN